MANHDTTNNETTVKLTECLNYADQTAGDLARKIEILLAARQNSSNPAGPSPGFWKPALLIEGCLVGVKAISDTCDHLKTELAGGLEQGVHTSTAV
jgi:hypothetical protein